jgi:hypothetical protein
MLQIMSHTGLKNMKNNFINILNLSPEVDYQTLMSKLQDYSHPRRQLQLMNNEGCLIRLKKGFYILSKELIKKDYSAGIVANLLYGPSYLSMEYALSHYGFLKS